MAEVQILAVDLAKRSFQVCASDRAGWVLYNWVISRTKLEALLRAQPPCIVAMEACATSHFWGRLAEAHGHEMRLIPPIYVKPFVKQQKNDAANAAANAEAALRPNRLRVGRSRLACHLRMSEQCPVRSSNGTKKLYGTVLAYFMRTEAVCLIII
ncbi:IS110 family transposase [Methylobacterium nigriterrae]|uniref:IS110 family transposase n=1 Tax=Methylobacterium nigriterrae TaxID=3127512 RepID=UPI003D671F6B